MSNEIHTSLIKYRKRMSMILLVTTPAICRPTLGRGVMLHKTTGSFTKCQTNTHQKAYVTSANMKKTIQSPTKFETMRHQTKSKNDREKTVPTFHEIPGSSANKWLLPLCEFQLLHQRMLFCLIPAINSYPVADFRKQNLMRSG